MWGWGGVAIVTRDFLVTNLRRRWTHKYYCFFTPFQFGLIGKALISLILSPSISPSLCTLPMGRPVSRRAWRARGGSSNIGLPQSSAWTAPHRQMAGFSGLRPAPLAHFDSSVRITTKKRLQL